MSIYSELISTSLTHTDILNVYKALDTLITGRADAEAEAHKQIAIMQCFNEPTEYATKRRQEAFKELLKIAISTETAPIHT